MSAQQPVRRMISMPSGVSMQILKRGDVAPEDYEKLDRCRRDSQNVANPDR